EDDLRSDLGGVRGDAIERECSGEGGLVHEHELPGLKVPAPVVVFVEELRGVLCPPAERVAEHFGSRRRRRKRHHPVAYVRRCPRTVQGAQRRGLTRTRRADQQIKGQPGTGDARDSDGLVSIEPHAPDLAGSVPRDEPRGQRWPAAVLAVSEEALLGVEDVLTGVSDLIDRLEPVALTLDVMSGYGTIVVRGEPQRFGFGVRDDLIEHPETVV